MRPPEKPPRRPFGSVTSEPNEARAPHTPVPPPDALPTAPPPAMPMPPPRAYEGPRRALFEPQDERTLIGVAPPAERRPAPVNPPPPDPHHAASAPERITELPGQVTIGKGPWTMTMPSAVALALITTVGGFAVAWLNKPSPGDPAQIAAAVESSLAKNREETSRQLAAFDKRLDGFETTLTETKSALSSLHDRVNDKIVDARAPATTPLSGQVSTQLRK